MIGPQLIDVSHVIESGMVTYKGLPAPLVCDYLSREQSRSFYAPGTEFQIGKVEMVANTGTYIDSPFHRYAHGVDIAAMPLTAVANLDAVVVTVAPNQRAIGADVLRDLDVRGKAVLIHTAWDRHWRTDAYFERHPHLTADAADYLAAHGAALVGIDSFNIDDTSDGARPVHTILLGENIPIVEHLCGLQHVPHNGAQFFAAPLKVRAMGTFPVRGFAMVPRPAY